MDIPNIKEFIDFILEFDNVEDILNTCELQYDKYFVFKILFDIVIKFGFCNIFNNINFTHLIGNFHNGKFKPLKNFNKYLTKKVIREYSNIVLQNKNDNTYIFISFKYPKSDEDIKKQSNIDYYNIKNIIVMISHNNHIYKKFKLYLVVYNKKKVLDIFKNSTSINHITEHNILDINDLNKYFLLFKQFFIENNNNNI